MSFFEVGVGCNSVFFPIIQVVNFIIQKNLCKRSLMASSTRLAGFAPRKIVLLKLQPRWFKNMKSLFGHSSSLLESRSFLSRRY